MSKFYELSGKRKPLFERSWHDDPFIMDDLVLDYALNKETGNLKSRFEICVNSFGQNVASQAVQNSFPEQVKLLEDIFLNEKPVSAASRSGAIIDGEPAIILTYSFDGNILNHRGVTDCNFLHAQTRMMAEQLNEALLTHGVNICATFNSDFKSEDDVADGIHVIIPADKEYKTRAEFEKEFDAVLTRLALSKDFEWVKQQYDVMTNEFAGNTEVHCRPNVALQKGCSFSDIVIEAFGFLGQHIGARQFLFDKFRFSHDMEGAQKLAEKCDLSKNHYLFDKCLHDGALRAEHNGAKKLTLYIKSPLDSLYSPSTDRFQITKNELRSILNEMGYARDFSIPSFMCSYSYEAAAEIKSIYEDRHRKPLNQRLSEAEQKRNGSKHGGPAKNKDQEHDL